MSTAKKVAIIVTSTRTPRVGPAVADVVKEVFKPAAAAANIDLSTLDVASFNLPIYDEAIIPAMVPASGTYAHQHSLDWSAAIARHDAYIFVQPEYNFGMAASTKNAIDYLFNEWTGRPVAIVSYGIFGAKNASEQVSAVLTGMKLRVAETRPSLEFVGNNKGPDLFAAMNEGKLGQESKEAWTTGEPKEQLLRAFAELQKLLQE